MFLARFTLLMTAFAVLVTHGAAQNLHYNAAGQLTQMSTTSGVTSPVIVTPPASATVELGQAHALSVTATGNPLSYQWYKNGTLLPGQTNPSLVFTSIAPGDITSYTVVVLNFMGSATSSPAVLSLPPNPFTAPLGGVGDGWATSGNTLWRVITTPGYLRVPGNAVVGTGTAYEDDSYIESTITVTQPTTLRYWMKLPGAGETGQASNQLYPSRLRTVVNGHDYASFISYGPSDDGLWHQQTLHLPAAGTYSLRWQHDFNGYALIDDITLTAATDTDNDGLSDEWETEHLGGLAALPGDDPDSDLNSNLVEYRDITLPQEGASFLIHLNLVLHGSGQVQRSLAEPVTGYALGSQVEVTPMPDAGHVFLGWEDENAVFTNHVPNEVMFFGFTRTLHAYFEPQVTLAVGADTTGITWTTSGASAWISQSRTTSDGVDALMSGPLPKAVGTLQQNWVEAQITGPVRLRYEHRGTGTLQLHIDGLLMASDSSIPGWEEKNFFLPPGNHTVRWTHQKLNSEIHYLDKVNITTVTDSDSDGLPDEWEMLYFGDLTQNGTQDFDSDGVSNANEYADISHPASGGEYRVRYTLNTTGIGTVSISPAAASYLAGQPVIITAMPSSGWTLLRWQGPTLDNESSNPVNQPAYVANNSITAHFVPADDLNTALDNTAQTFTNTLPGWSRVTGTTHDGVDAAQSPGTSSGMITTTVTGPKVVSFWWKLDQAGSSSGLSFYDQLGTYINYSDPAGGWQQVVIELPAGDNTLTWSFSRSDYLPSLSNAWLDQVSITAVSAGFNGWASTNGLSGPSALPLAEPQQDGVVNLLKYAFNMPASTPANGSDRYLTPGSGSSGLPAVTLSGPGGDQRLRLEYVRRRSPSDLTYTAQFSPDLTPGGWVNATSGETVTILNATWERVVIEDTVTTQSSQPRFARVRVVQNP